MNLGPSGDPAQADRLLFAKPAIFLAGTRLSLFTTTVALSEPTLPRSKKRQGPLRKNTGAKKVIALKKCIVDAAEIPLTPLQLIDHTAAPVPPPRTHRHATLVCWRRIRLCAVASRIPLREKAVSLNATTLA